MAREDDRLPGSQQESIATAIALCADDNSNLVASLIEIELFDTPYDDIVGRCLEYRKSYKRPPGKGHIDDVFAHVLENKEHKSHNLYHTIISKMVQQAERVNTSYLLDTVSNFVYKRRFRAGIARLAERYEKGGDEQLLDELEEISRQNLKIRSQQRDYGFSLADQRALGFLDRDPKGYCNIGIKELDERGVVPTRKEMLAFLSPPNRGKSYFLVHCGKQALLNNWSVAHYSLENSEEMTAQRYFMNLFNGVRRSGTYRYVRLSAEKENSVKLVTETLTPDFIVENTDATYAFLEEKIKAGGGNYWRERLSKLRIRRFPSGRLTYEMLERDLDDLKAAYGFEPDLLMVDMPQLMKLPRREKDYTSLDELVTNLRGLAVDRNIAVVIPQQGNRSSNAAKSVQAQHGSGSFGVFGIADNQITYSQTSSEEEHGLARLYTQKVRNDRARMTIVISQHYDSGQFCMSSYPMTSSLRDQIKDYVGYKSGEAEDVDDEYEPDGGKRAAE